jgi:large subunit ribosomal protein L29
MKNSELRNLTEDQLNERVSELSLNLFNYRFTARVGSLDNPSLIKSTRRELARIKTILTERKESK